jgi:hypothetical protein
MVFIKPILIDAEPVWMITESGSRPKSLNSYIGSLPTSIYADELRFSAAFRLVTVLENVGNVEGFGFQVQLMVA